MGEVVKGGLNGRSNSAAKKYLRLVFSPSRQFLQWEALLRFYVDAPWIGAISWLAEVLSTLAKAVAQEIVELGDRIDLLDCYIQRIGNPSKFELVVVQNYIARIRNPIAGLTDTTHIYHHFGATEREIVAQFRRRGKPTVF